MVGIFLLLIFIIPLNPILSFVVNCTLSAGLAFGIAGFSLLVRALSRNKSLDMLGSGLFIVAFLIIGTVIATISPALFTQKIPTLDAQFWILSYLFEGFTLVLSLITIGRKPCVSYLNWLYFALAGAVAVLVSYTRFSLFQFAYSQHLSHLGLAILSCAIVLLFTAIILGARPKVFESHKWAHSLSFAATIILLSAFISFPLSLNLYTQALGSFIHLIGFCVLFFSVLRYIVLDPLSSIYEDITTERNQYALWDSLANNLLDFNERIASASTLSDISREALETLRRAFGNNCIAFFSLTPDQNIRYLCPPRFGEFLLVELEGADGLKQQATYAPLESHMRKFAAHHIQGVFSLQAFSAEFLDKDYRFFMCPLIAGEEEGFLVTGRPISGPVKDCELKERFYAKFASMIALAEKNLRLEAERDRQERRALVESNKIAQTLQEAIMPLKNPFIDNNSVLIAPYLHAAPGLAKIGGDFFDAFCISPDLIGFSIGDISGHGVDAAAYNAMVRSSIRALGLQNFDPADVITATNRHIISELRGSLFATAIYGVLNTDTGDATFCIAGHPDPLIIGPQKPHDFESVTNPMLGFIEDCSYTSFAVKLERKESIILYTDGLTEAHNNLGEEFGLERLVNILSTKRGKTPPETVQRLFNEVEVFCGTREPEDDRAMLVIRWDPSLADASAASEE